LVLEQLINVLLATHELLLRPFCQQRELQPNEADLARTSPYSGGSSRHADEFIQLNKGPLEAFFNKDFVIVAKRHLKGYQRGAEDSEGPNDPKNLIFTESSVLEVFHQEMISCSIIVGGRDTELNIRRIGSDWVEFVVGVQAWGRERR